MASKAFVNSMATIAICEAQINVLMSQLPDDDLEKIMGALVDAKAACNDAYGSWTGSIDAKGMARLNRILDKFQSSLKSLEIAEFTSTTLAILESLRAKLKTKRADKNRIKSITNLIAKFYAVHDFFDPDGDLLEQYTRADGIGRRWAELMEA